MIGVSSTALKRFMGADLRFMLVDNCRRKLNPLRISHAACRSCNPLTSRCINAMHIRWQSGNSSDYFDNSLGYKWVG